MTVISKKRLRKEFQGLRNLNKQFTNFIDVLQEKYDMDDNEKKAIESMKQYFERTDKLFANMEEKCN